MEKNRLKDIKEIIIAFLFAIVFIFSQIFAYYQGVIFGADNHEIVEEVKDDVFNKKESNRRFSSVGTVLPNSGYVGKIYFNTLLTKQEVSLICSQLTYQDLSSYGLGSKYILAISEDTTKVITISDVQISVFDFTTLDFVQDIYYRDSNDGIFWKVDDFDFNSNALSTFLGFPVGAENNLLTNLVSINPFPSDRVATVPNYGYIEKVYLNTTLTTEETVDILSQLTYTNSSVLELTVYGLLYKHDYVNDEWVDLILIIFKFDDLNYGIMDFSNENVYFSTLIIPESPFTFIGWNPSFNGEVIVNGNVLNQLQDVPFGNENYKLTSLFSITPFVEEDDKPLFFEQFIDDASDIVLGFITILVNATVSLTDVMFDESTNQLTIVGSAFALALAVGVVYLFFRLIRGLIKSNNRG